MIRIFCWFSKKYIINILRSVAEPKLFIFGYGSTFVHKFGLVQLGECEFKTAWHVHCTYIVQLDPKQFWTGLVCDVTWPEKVFANWAHFANMPDCPYANIFLI